MSSTRGASGCVRSSSSARTSPEARGARSSPGQQARRRGRDERAIVARRRGGDDETLPVIREQLRVAKRIVETGGIRVYQRALESPVEEPVVSKQARVVEEVRIGKEETERTENIRDTVRSTEIDVQEVGEHALAGRNSADRSDRDAGEPPDAGTDSPGTGTGSPDPGAGTTRNRSRRR